MRRRRHRSGVRHRRSALVVIVGCVGLAATLATALMLSSRPGSPEPTAETSEVFPIGTSPFEDPAFPTDLVSDAGLGTHPVYRHSIVAGGVHSLADVESAVALDPVVQRHYSNVSVENLQVVRTPARREAYMSYRIGDRVYWTSKKIALAEGEAVLTDGATTIRARCGNLVSDEAMSPTSAAEPPASAFEEVVPPPSGDASASSGVAGVSGEAPGASQSLSAGPGNSSGPAVGAPASSQSFGGGSVGPFGGSGGIVVPPGGQTARNPGGSSPGVSPPGGGPGGIPPSGPNPPGFPPGFGDPPGFDNPPGFPPGLDPPGFGDPPGFDDPDGSEWPDGPGGPNPPVIVIEPPPPVTPVPEPGSLLLLGSGLALAAWRARRRRSRHKDS